MATKSKKVNPLKKGIKVAKNINDKAVKFSSEIVEETVATGKDWQKIFAKTAKGGVELAGHQQELALTVLESLKKQYQTGGVRLRKLLELEKIEAAWEETQEDLEESVKSVRKSAKKMLSNVVVKGKKAASEIQEEIAEEVEELAETAEEALENVEEQLTRAQKAVRKAASKTTKTKKTASTKKKTAKKVAGDNLKVIEGIGPKIESLLKEAGITTYRQLSDATIDAVKQVLLSAGPRYKMHDPSTWMKQAALAADGKMEELKKLQDELKGGRAK